MTPLIGDSIAIRSKDGRTNRNIRKTMLKSSDLLSVQHYTILAVEPHPCKRSSGGLCMGDHGRASCWLAMLGSVSYGKPVWRNVSSTGPFLKTDSWGKQCIHAGYRKK